MPSKLIFDLRATQPHGNIKFHGGSEYAIQVFNEAIDSGYTNFDCYYDPKRQLAKNILEKCDIHNIKTYPISSSDDLQQLINSNNYDAFYSALPYDLGKINFNKTNLIFTIHGLREIECPEDRYDYLFSKNPVKYKIKKIAKSIIKPDKVRRQAFIKFNKLFKKKNNTIIAVSYHTKYSLLSYFPYLKESDISVFYSPFDISKTDNNEDNIEQIDFLPKEKFFLIISANRWVKNAYRAIVAFDNLFSEGKLQEYKVLILGMNEDRFTKRVKNCDKFIFKNYVSTSVLSKLFSKAFALMYPSLNEGFGYPPVLAMNFGLPILASNTTSIPEVCDNAAIYFNPMDIHEIKSRILYLVFDQKRRKQLIENCSIRLKYLNQRQKDDLAKLVHLIFNDSSSY